MPVPIRPLRPSDYHPVISVVDSWWNGLVGLLSQSHPGEAYIHFVGIHPAERGRGLGRQLYQHFFAAAQARGAGLVRAVTAPVNQGSVRFHQQLGFGIEPGDREVDGVPVATGYDGDGQDRVRFIKHLTI